MLVHLEQDGTALSLKLSLSTVSDARGESEGGGRVAESESVCPVTRSKGPRLFLGLGCCSTDSRLIKGTCCNSRATGAALTPHQPVYERHSGRKLRKSFTAGEAKCIVGELPAFVACPSLKPLENQYSSVPLLYCMCEMKNSFSLS